MCIAKKCPEQWQEFRTKVWLIVLVFIEKYTRGVSAVEGILTLDRLRQSVAVKELLQSQGQHLTLSAMRKTCSVPNFSQVLTSLDYYLYCSGV